MTFTKAMTMLALMAAVAAPVMATAADITLYEPTSGMMLTAGGDDSATPRLIGYAAVGTPLCPTAVIEVVSPRATRCSLNVTGSDKISSRTGLGDFDGRFAVAVDGERALDGSELVLTSGIFRGRMDFSPALTKGLPFGTVEGTMSVRSNDDEHDSYRSVPFTGVFWLPFATRDEAGARFDILF